MSDESLMWERRCSLLLFSGDDYAEDFSDFHVTFEVKQDDNASPNNARIRIENLSKDTENAVQKQFTRVILQAGYWGAPYGVIFTGSIVQFAKGRTSPTTSYLDILAADGDMAYNFAMINITLDASSTDGKQRIDAVINAMKAKGVDPGEVQIPYTGGTLPRGKVLFGLARASMRQITKDRGASWNILKGRVNVILQDGYLPGEAVVLTAQTGLIGRAEQTENGITCRCLINPQIQVGCLVKLDNAVINNTQQARKFALEAGQQPYDRYAGVQMLADIAADGLYRVYVVEYKGDTRGQDWYADLTLLAVNPVSNKVEDE